MVRTISDWGNSASASINASARAAACMRSHRKVDVHERSHCILIKPANRVVYGVGVLTAGITDQTAA